MKKVFTLAFTLIILAALFISCGNDNPPFDDQIPKSPITLTVSPSGDDSKADGTTENPFATIDAAVKSSFLTGADRYSTIDIIIKEGEYSFSSPIVVHKIEGSAPIRFIGEGNVILNGDNTAGIFEIHNDGVTLEKLTIAYSDGYGIVATADNFSVIDCEISNIAGEYAIKIRGSNITINGNHIHDCAANAITIDAGDMETLTRSNSIIYNNLIHDCGNEEENTPLINACGVEINVSHNEIYNSTSSAIYWNGAYITIEYNNIHDVVSGGAGIGAVFSDSMVQVDNVIRYNYIHNIGGVQLHEDGVSDYSSGICAKSFASYFEAYGNIIETVNGNGMQIGGRNTSVCNNLIIDCANWYIWNVTHAYSRFFKYNETDGKLIVPDYIYSPIWKEANPDLALIVTDLNQTVPRDPYAWACPSGNVMKENWIHFNKAIRYFTNWGTSPYSIEDTVYTFSKEHIDVPYDARENKNMSVYNSRRDEVDIPAILSGDAGVLVDMTSERFATIGRVMSEWNID